MLHVGVSDVHAAAESGFYPDQPWRIAHVEE